MVDLFYETKPARPHHTMKDTLLHIFEMLFSMGVNDIKI